MRKLCVLAFMFVPSVCLGDWGIDFYRYQCVPELGRIFLDTFHVQNPDDYGKISSLDSNRTVFAVLAKKHEIYAVEGSGREFRCSLGSNALRIVLAFALNSQGQSVGRITVESDKGKLIGDLDLFAYYGHSPLVHRIEISVVSGRGPSGLYASFEVTGAQGHANFSFNRELTANNPLTNASVQEAMSRSVLNGEAVAAPGFHTCQTH